MAKIIGNTTATPNPRPDWAQTDETKADYIKNKPNITNGEGLDSIIQKYSGEVDDNHYGNTNTGESAVVFGEANTNSENRALLAGKLNNNSGANTIVGGLRNTVKAGHGITGGSGNTVDESAIRSIGAGYNNTNSGEDSVQAGHTNMNSGIRSIQNGNGNNNSGSHSIQSGDANANTGSRVIQSGRDNVNDAPYALQTGRENTQTSTAQGSIQAGKDNLNEGADSIQTGTFNKNYGTLSVESGNQNINRGNCSALLGQGLRNEQQNEDGTYNTKVIVGKWNEDKLQNIFEVGNGSSDKKRFNAFEVLIDGRAKVQAAPVEDNDVVRKQELDLSWNSFNIENGEGTDSLVQKYTGEVDDTHYGNTNTGESAVVFGEANNNSATRALIAGKMNTNIGSNSIISGFGNNNAAHNSLLVGLENINSPSDSSSDGGKYSIVAGNGNKNYGFSSIITGNGIINTNKYAIVCGKHNIDAADAYLIVGNGKNSLEGNQSNAFVVYADGRATVQSAPENDKDVVRLADLTASTAGNNGYAASFKSLQSHKLPTDRNDVLRLSDLSSGLDAQFGIINCYQVSAGNGGVQSNKLPTLANDVLRLNDVTRHWCDMKVKSLSISNHLSTESPNIVLESSGNAIFNGKLTVGGNVAIQGNLTVSGETTTLDTVTLQVQDNVIVANADGVELVENAGFAMKTTATAAYGIMYDPAGDGVKIGLGAFNDAGKFIYAENEAQFLATRADSIVDGNLPVWNDTTKSFEDSNVNVSDLQNTVKTLQEQVAALQEALAAITAATADDIQSIFNEEA